MPKTILAKHVREGDWLAAYPQNMRVIQVRENRDGFWIYTDYGHDNNTHPDAGSGHWYEPNEAIQIER